MLGPWSQSDAQRTNRLNHDRGHRQRAMAKHISLAELHRMGIRAHVLGRSAAGDDDQGVRLDLRESREHVAYANAQLDDYRIDERNRFRWKANVQLQLHARFSADAETMTGTAGFGFWNAPVGIGVRRAPSPPAAAWFFFAGPNSNIATAQGVPGSGWKAAALDARSLPFFLLLPTAPVALPLMRIPLAYRLLWPVAQRAMRADEKILTASLDQWHEYTITWTQEMVRYHIDGDEVHVNRRPPTGSMGLVIWIDNQYMVATPQGRCGQGVVPVTAPRSLEISDLSLREVK